MAQYRVITELGVGGTAEVYLAVREQPGGFQKLTVLKSPRRSFTTREHFVEMFRHEARLAARLKHPHIVEVYEVVEDRGLPVIAMEYLEGGTLRELTEGAREAGTPLPLREHLEILRATCLGLHYCHELCDFDGTPMGLVHRDVSPHNVFISFDGAVKLLDFGIAKVVGSDGDTETGMVKGKVRYMAPEHMLGEAVDHRSDVYAIGVLLWEAVTAVPMWRDVNDAVLMHCTVNGELPELRPREGCPDRLVEVLLRCLARDPDARVQTGHELATLLESVIDVLPRNDRSYGELAAELLAERRIKLRELVSGSQTGLPAQIEATGPIDWSRQPMLTTLETDAPARPSPRTRANGVRKHLVFAAGLAAACSAGLAIGTWTWLRAPVAPAAASNLVLPAALPHVPLPAPHSDPVPEHVVEITIVVEPAVARITLDGAPVPNPFEARVPRDARVHAITVQASGYETTTHEVAFDRDLRVSLQLRPKPLRVPTREDPAEPAAKPPTPAADPPCDPPFFVDDRGVKRFKRECL